MSYSEWIDLKSALKNLRAQKNKKQDSLIPIKIAFLRNYTVERIIPYLELFLVESGFSPTFYLSGYDNIFQDLLNPESDYISFRADITIVSLNTELISPTLYNSFAELGDEIINKEVLRVINYFDELIGLISKNNDNLTLVHNFEAPLNASMGILDFQRNNFQVNTFRKMNMSLVEICQASPNVNIVDIDFLQGVLGKVNSHDNRFWHIEKNPYTQKFLQLISREYIKFIKSVKGKVKKCLVLDLDNTLWGGIIGEDGLAGIKLGASYPGSGFQEFQKSILNLYNRGVIIGICSKNNMEDVEDVFENHPDMLIRKEHISIIKANWNNKASNILEISNELNIGLDSIVFVDDNPFEINLVSEQLPTVSTFLLPKDSTTYANILSEAAFFDSLSFSDEDKKRTKQYQVEIERLESKSKYCSIEGYLASLEMDLKFHINDSFSAPRIFQLCQRTNQFNLTTKRYTDGEINSFIEDEKIDVIALGLSDRFGDLGIIGAAIINYEKESKIDTFLLSCRSLGREVERAFLHKCCEMAHSRGMTMVNATYIRTKKNKQVESFYVKNGFNMTSSSNNEQVFQLDLKNNEIKLPPFFKTSVNEDNDGRKN
jgi:FkbH-like protein